MPTQRNTGVVAAKNKATNILSPAVSPDINADNFNVGGSILQTAQLMSALKGVPAVPPGVPMGTQFAPTPNMVEIGGQQAAGTIVPMPVTNAPSPTLTPIPSPEQTIMGMPPEQFAAIAGMLGSALAPQEYGPLGQAVPSRMGKLGDLGGALGLSQMLRKQGGGGIATGGK